MDPLILLEGPFKFLCYVLFVPFVAKTFRLLWLEFADTGHVCAGTDAVFQGSRIVLYGGITTAFCLKRRRCEVSSRPIECSERNSSVDVAVTTTVTNQLAFAKHEYRPFEV